MRPLFLLSLWLLLSSTSFAEETNSVENRLTQEKKAFENSFLLIPHKANYILPLTYLHRKHEEVNAEGNMDMQSLEAKFQISLKVPLWTKPLFGDNGYLFGAYTNTSAWQAYNREESSPFRDSNHEPEIFMQFNTPWKWGDLSIPTMTPGFSHQSNGQPVERSRSWNRIYLSTTFAYKDWYVVFKPWWRLPEKEKRRPTDAKGDDNPDIHQYYGYFELNVIKPFGDNTVNVMLRNNLNGNNNRGAIEVNYTYPLNKRIRGYVQLFHGYGDMMLDYQYRNTRIGFGFMFNDWL